MRSLVVFLLMSLPGPAASLRYWIEPCTRAETNCRPADADLAQWALEAWQSESSGKLTFTRVADRAQAEIRFFWIGARDGLYGETRGGDIYVRPEAGDSLLRETIVYLTCLHEAGHALGLRHTANFEDIMYNFQFGGDIAEYFNRYARKLTRRTDVRKNSGISVNDRRQLASVTAVP
jgi:hypothetical protein